MRDHQEAWEKRPEPLRKVAGGQAPSTVEETFQKYRAYLDDPMLHQQNDPFPLDQYMNTRHASTRGAPDRRTPTTEYPSLKRALGRTDGALSPSSSPSPPPSPSPSPSPPPSPSPSSSCSKGYPACWWQANKEFFYLLFHQGELESQAKKQGEGKWKTLFEGKERWKYLLASGGILLLLLVILFFLFSSSSSSVGAPSFDQPPDVSYYTGPVTVDSSGRGRWERGSQ